MTAQSPIRFRLADKAVRMHASAAVWEAPDGWTVEIKPPKRTLDANAKFHAMLADIVKSGFEHGGRHYDIEDLKTLFVSSWLIQTGRRSEIVKGFDGEMVQLRRSTTTFSRQEMGELIDLVEAFAAQHGIRLSGPEYDR